MYHHVHLLFVISTVCPAQDEARQQEAAEKRAMAPAERKAKKAKVVRKIREPAVLLTPEQIEMNRALDLQIAAAKAKIQQKMQSEEQDDLHSHVLPQMHVPQTQPVAVLVEPLWRLPANSPSRVDNIQTKTSGAW